MTDDTPISSTAPAALSAALRGRLLSAMNAEARQSREERETECLLALLSPAPLSVTFRARLSGLLRRTARSVKPAPAVYRRPLFRWAVAAAMVLLCVPVSMSLFGTAAAQPGLASRSVLERTGGDDIIWQENGDPVRRYDVVYEDSLILPGEDDTTLVIRVPNRTTVHVKGEVI